MEGRIWSIFLLLKTYNPESSGPKKQNRARQPWERGSRPITANKVAKKLGCYQEGSISLLSFSIGGRQTKSHNHRKLTNLITWNTALSNSMKLWAMPRRATQDAWLMVENSDKSWSTGDVNGKPLQYSCLENPMNSIKRQKDRTLEDEPSQVGRCPICYWRSLEK